MVNRHTHCSAATVKSSAVTASNSRSSNSDGNNNPNRYEIPGSDQYDKHDKEIFVKGRENEAVGTRCGRRKGKKKEYFLLLFATR